MISPKHKAEDKSKDKSKDKMDLEKSQTHDSNQQVAQQKTNDRLDSVMTFDKMRETFNELDKWAESFGFPSSRFSRSFFEGNYPFEQRISRIMDDFRDLRHSSSMFGHDDEFFNHTQQLFDKFANNQIKHEETMKPDDPEVEVLAHPKDLEDLYNRYKSQEAEGKGVVKGKSYVSSTIYKDGKAVTVKRHSELTPEGVINTRLQEKFIDEKGHDQTHSWKKKYELGSNKQQNMIKEEHA